MGHPVYIQPLFSKFSFDEGGEGDEVEDEVKGGQGHREPKVNRGVRPRLQQVIQL